MTISAEEIATWHKLYDETQEALQRIGGEFGVLAGEERTSGIRRVLTEQRARIAALEAQLAEAVAALKPFASVGRIIDGPFGPALFAKDEQAFKNGCAWRENGEDKFLTWGDFRRAAAFVSALRE